MRKKVVLCLLILSMQTVYASQGKVRISSDKEASYIYINDEKRSITGEGYTTITLDNGEYTIKVSKQLSNGKVYSLSKTIFVSHDTSLSLNFILEEQNKDWQKDKAGVSKKNTKLLWQDTGEVMDKVYTWNDAVKYCEDLSIDTFNQWRLPSYKELLTLIDYTTSDPAIVNIFQFVDVSNNYWTYSKQVGQEKKAWIVYFYNGSTYIDNIDMENTVRCVHDK